jgi:signal transduction histidine kinase
MFDSTAQKNATKDTNLVISQIDSLNKIAETLVRSNPDSALFILEKSEKLATSASYQEGIGVALKHKALSLNNKGKYEESLSRVEKSISILEKTSNKTDLAAAYGLKGYLTEQLGNPEMALENYTKSITTLKSVTDSDVSLKLAISYNLLGIHYQRKLNHTEALKYFNEALVLVENQNQSNFTSAFLSNIGNTYLYQKEYDKAITYYKKITAIQEKAGDKAGLAISYNNLGSAYLGKLETEKALPYLKKASQIYNETDNTRGYLLSEMNIGTIYYREEEYEKAKTYYFKCLEIEKQVIDKNILTMIYHYLGTIKGIEHDYDSAIIYAQKGLVIAEEIDSKNFFIDHLQLLSLSYEGKKDFEKAYTYHKLYTNQKDSIFNIEKASEVNALLLEQKNLENTQLEKDNIIKQNTLEKERLETQAQKQAVLILEKQAEADRLMALAKESKNKQEADSLFRAAKTAQLEADNLKIKAENLNVKAQKAEAEQKATELEAKRNLDYQKNISILFGIIVLAALIVAYVAYQNQQNKQKANLLLAEKNEEINLQNELLGQSNTMKDRLFSIIAHDLRNPIMAFQGITEQINFFLRKNKPERLLQMTESIDESAQNINHLLNNLLGWALTQTNQISLQKTDTNLFQNVEEVVKIYQMSAVIHQIELKSEVSKGLSVHVDKDSFQTILRNLVGNAIKYTPEDGKITLSAKPQNDKIILSITDTGTGMNEETKQKISQLSVGNTKRGLRGEKGTGLGLVLCYEFAELNNIKIEVESKENEGTTFSLEIPIKP